jgi:hypothetical protein
MLVRQLLSVEVTGDDVQFTVMAEFWMEGEELRADYREPGARMMMEREGIAHVSGRLYPRDGRRFFDHLPVAMSRLSFVTTRDVER